MDFDVSNRNVAAFLKLLRQLETSGLEDGWYRVNDGSAIGRRVAPAELLKGHPGRVGNRAAGAFQIRYNTFTAKAFLKYKFPDFRPPSQIICACAIMAEPYVGNAYADVLAGDFNTAVKKLTGQWKGRAVQFSSLPGGGEPQITLAAARSFINSNGGSWA